MTAVEKQHEYDRAYYERNRRDPKWLAKRAAQRSASRNRNLETERARDRAKVHSEATKHGRARYRRERYASDPDFRERCREIGNRHDRRRRARYAEADVHPLVVLERADGVCGICGEDVDPQDFHVDHVIPLARGGEHSYDNVQPSHPTCNRRKNARLQEELI